MKRYCSSLFFSIIILAICVSCKRIETEQSPILHEDAVVMETVYTPSKHELGLGVTAIKIGGGLGVDFSGDLGLGIGSRLQVSSSEVPEKFAVVFKCKHGKFIVERKEIYEKLKGKDGRNVDISYTEVYRTTYEKKDGKEYVSNRVLTKYHLVDATLK